MKNKTLSIATLLLTGALLLQDADRPEIPPAILLPQQPDRKRPQLNRQTALHRLLPTALLPQMIFSRTWILQI